MAAMPPRFDIAEYDTAIPSIQYLNAQTEEYNRVMAECAAKTEPVEETNVNQHDTTPASTLGASTLVDQSPMTPSRKSSVKGPLVHRKSNSSNIIANGHLASSSAGSREMNIEHIPGNASADDPFVATSSSTNGGSSVAYLPRADRDLSEINADNAQSVLAPNACVFVANLLSTKTDDELCRDVGQVFQAFGECYTKVRRDEKGMPFAFVQFRERFDSETAIEHGRGLIVSGRPCRTERAKVPRALYLSRIVGGQVNEKEARSVLEGYGAIEKVWFASPTDREMFRLPLGIWVEFAYFGDARDAKNAMKNSTKYRLEQPPLPDDLKARIDSRYFEKRASGVHSRTSLGSNALERRSLFLGNLAFTINPDQIYQAFSKFGNVRSIEIMFRIQSVHGFVEYDTENAAFQALQADHIVAGRRLRVEPRMSAPTRNVNVNGANGSAGNAYSNSGISMGGMSSGYPVDSMNGIPQPYVAAQMMQPYHSLPHMPQGLPNPHSVLPLAVQSQMVAPRLGFDATNYPTDPHYGMPQQNHPNVYPAILPGQQQHHLGNGFAPLGQ